MIIKQIGIAVTLLTLSSVAFAAKENASQEKNSNKSKNSMMAPSLGDKLPPYTNPNRFVFDATFIYWQAYEDGLEFGLVENSSERESPIIFGETGPNGGYAISGIFKDKKLDFKWEPGFKVGIGAIFGERDQWDLFLNWTWLQSKASASFTGTQNSVADLSPDVILSGAPVVGYNQYVVPSWGSIALGGPARSASSHWLLHYNTIDLELGRNFFLETNLTVRPHIGLRGAFIHQSIKANYNSVSNGVQYQEDGVPIPNAETFSHGNKFKGKNHFDGIGLRGGLDVNWNFLKNFAVYGKGSGSILFGHFDVYENFVSDHNVIFQNYPLVSTPFNLRDAHDLTIDDNYQRIRSTLQLALGFTWHTGFHNDKQHLFVSVGYEFNQWFQQNELREFLISPPPNDLLVPDPAIPGGIPVNVQNYIIQEQFSFFDESTIPTREGDLGLQGLTFDVRFDF